jgi:E3 ubiquitin-protein ligase RNF13/E3 ubiquitin-protein ligase RNF167
MYSPSDASDITIAATFIKYSDYMELSSLIAKSNTSHSGLKTLSLLITSEYSAWEWYSPIITFIIILLLPSSLTFLTLLIHRVRAARAAQRERAPEDFVQSLPWRVWTVNGWEKHDGTPPRVQAQHSEQDVESADNPPTAEAPSTSHVNSNDEDPPWFDAQVECAICLSEFEIGDRVRVLPCRHIFHMEEVDGWLIQRKKLCPVCKADVTHPTSNRVRNSVEEDNNTTSPAQSRSISLATERTPLLQHNNTSPSS